MVPPDSTGIPRDPAYSGTRPTPYSRFAYGTLTPYGPPFQARSATLSVASRQAPQPRNDLLAAVWAAPRSLAATWGIS